jgi:hypothetical protein
LPVLYFHFVTPYVAMRLEPGGMVAREPEFRRIQTPELWRTSLLSTTVHNGSVRPVAILSVL